MIGRMTSIKYPLSSSIIFELYSFLKYNLLTPTRIGKGILEGLDDLVLQVFAKFFETPDKN